MGKTVAQVSEILELLLHRVTFIDPALIGDVAWKQAKTLVASVDPNDEDYVALSLHLNVPLWTGDLKLIKALKTYSVKTLTTAEVRQLHIRR